MTLRPLCQRARRFLPVPALLAALLGAVTAGCIIIPTPENILLEGRGVIEEKEEARFVPGETRREDVLLRFGEPDLVADEGRLLAYHWARASAWVFIGAYPGGAVMPLARHHFLVLEFNAAGLLQRHEFLDKLPESMRGPEGKRPFISPGKRQVIVVNPLTGWPDEAARLPAGATPLRLAIGEFLSAGADGAAADFLGQVKSIGIVVADVRAARPAADYVSVAVAVELARSGHTLVAAEDAEILVTGDVTHFGLTTQMRWSLSAYALTSLDVTLRFSCVDSSRELLQRRFLASASSGSIDRVPLPVGEFQAVATACLEDLQRQLREDSELAALLAAGHGLCR